MVGYNITMGGWVYSDGDEFIHDPMDLNRQVHNARVNLNADGVSTLTFTMPPTHPLATEIEVLRFGNTDKSISVYFDDRQLFHGTVVSKAEDMNGEITVACKDDLYLLEVTEIYLFDTVSLTGEADKWYPSMLMEEVAKRYNEIAPQDLQISPYKAYPDVGYTIDGVPLKVVDVPTGSSMSALDVLKSVFVDRWGCTLSVKFSEKTGQLRLYVSEIPSNVSQTVRFGENLVDYESEVSVGSVYTAIMPIGKGYDYYLGQVQGKFRLTRTANAGSNELYGVIVDASSSIRSVQVLVADGAYTYTVTRNSYGDEIYLEVTPDIAETMPSGTVLDAWSHDNEKRKVKRPMMLNKKPDGVYSGYKKKDVYLYNEEAVERYGPRTLVLNVADEGHVNNLMSMAIDELSKPIAVDMSLDIKAIDMALLSDSYQHLMVGERVRVISEPHGIDTTLMVSSMNVNLDNPAETSYVLGTRQSSISGKVERGRLNLAIMENNILYRMQTA